MAKLDERPEPLRRDDGRRRRARRPPQAVVLGFEGCNPRLQRRDQPGGITGPVLPAAPAVQAPEFPRLAGLDVEADPAVDAEPPHRSPSARGGTEVTEGTEARCISDVWLHTSEMKQPSVPSGPFVQG